MNNKDLIKKYVGSTGLSIPEYQFNKLNNNLKTSYLRKRIQATEASSGEYLRYFELVALPDDVRTKYINKLDSVDIYHLLSYSNEPDKIINILLSTKGFINKLDSLDIYHLLAHSTERDKIINVLLSTEGFINKLDSYSMRDLLAHSTERDKIINVLLSTKGFINKLDSDEIVYLLRYSNEPNKIKAILTKYGKI